MPGTSGDGAGLAAGVLGLCQEARPVKKASRVKKASLMFQPKGADPCTKPSGPSNHRASRMPKWLEQATSGVVAEITGDPVQGRAQQVGGAIVVPEGVRPAGSIRGGPVASSSSSWGASRSLTRESATGDTDERGQHRFGD